MIRRLFFKKQNPQVLTRALVLAVTLGLGIAIMIFSVSPAKAGPAVLSGTVHNGKANSLFPEMFFEPETPMMTLKQVPIWNELQQLLDNPYAVQGNTVTDIPGLIGGCTTTAGPCVDAAGPIPGTGECEMGPTPGSPKFKVLPDFPTYCTNPAAGFKRRPSFLPPGCTYDPSTGLPPCNDALLPPLLVHPLNYNPTTGVEMRIINSTYPGGPFVNTSVCQCLPHATNITVANSYPGGVSPYPDCQTTTPPTGITVTQSAGLWCNPYVVAPSSINVTSGASRLCGPTGCDTEVDYNVAFGPEITPSNIVCETNPEPVPQIPPGSLGPNNNSELLVVCGGDPGEPGYPGFGVLRLAAYSTPAVPGVAGPETTIASGQRLYDAARGGNIPPRDPTTGAGGLRKPSLAIPEFGGTPANPNYLWNSATNLFARAIVAGVPPALAPTEAPAFLDPSNENDYVKNRQMAMVLGKSLFWDMQVGSDAVQACGSCHAHAGADDRTKNQMSPNHIGTAAPVFDILPPNGDLTPGNFPFIKLRNPDISGDPLCNPPISANTTNFQFPDGDPVVHPRNPAVFTVCDSSNAIPQTAPDGTTVTYPRGVASSMGVHFGHFQDIAPIGPTSFTPPTGLVPSVLPDLRTPTNLQCVAAGNPAPCCTGAGVGACIGDIDNTDPIPGFAGVGGPSGHNQFRRVEPRNTPTIFGAAWNFDNFWDGRARHDFNGGSVFGASDPQSHVMVDDGAGNIVPTRQLIRFVSLASLATGPGLSIFEMSFVDRNWAKVAKKLLQPGVTPLANQLVDPTNSFLGPYSNQGGSACGGLAAADRSPGTPAPGKPGLCINYPALIRAAFFPALYSNTTQHLDGCFTDRRPDIHNQCAPGTVSIPVFNGSAVVNSAADPFDNFVLFPAPGAANPLDRTQFTQMEANFSLFWGLSIHLWVTVLVPDNTPFDQFLDVNPDIHHTVGETGEPLLVLDLPNCPTPGVSGRDCFREFGNFKRDSSNSFANGPGSSCINPYGLTCNPVTGGCPAPSTCNNPLTACTHFRVVAGLRICDQTAVAGGTRVPGSNTPDPLLGMDIFFGSNASLKNFEFRSARCGACHNAGNLTDNTFPFTIKAQLMDGLAEFFSAATPPALLPFGLTEPTLEPMGRMRVISGFLLEEEANSNGQDAIERKLANECIVPAPDTGNPNCPTANCAGYASPDGITNPTGTAYVINHEIGAGTFGFTTGNQSPVPFTSYGGAFFDNGVYNIGVTPCVANESGVIPGLRCDDNGRGNTDAFGWPMSLAAMLMKNLGGVAQEPGVTIPTFNNAICNTPPPGMFPWCTGGLWENTAQDQQINPGIGDHQKFPLLPPHLYPWINRIPVGDAHPQLDEGGGPVGAMVNTLMDSPNSEGFPEVPFNPQGILTETMNAGQAPVMGTWPMVNRVNRFGSVKAPQLRNVELTGPYFHNGGKLTLRQVVDFYVRGGDFPITNATHRDFNIINLNDELQSNLSEAEKVSLVDFMIELTDSRVRFEQAPFDPPEIFLPLDGTAPENTFGREGFLANIGNGMFMRVPGVGAKGRTTPLTNFLGVSSKRGALLSHFNSVTETPVITFGISGDKPLAGDWTGTGTTTIGVYRPSNQTFYLRNSNTTGVADIVVHYGMPGDIPIVGNWTGTGTTTVGVYRPSNQTFYLRNSNTTGVADIVAHYGLPGDIPVVGNWTGTGTTTIGVYRPSNQTFYLRNSNTTGVADIVVHYGSSGNIPVVGNWTGTGTTTVGLYRPSKQTFYLRNSNTTGVADVVKQLGILGDIPIVGDWNGIGRTGLGVYRPSTSSFILLP